MIQAVLFDLGNVVLEVDFRRTFRHWAGSAGVDESHLHQHWSLDEAYAAHETGRLEFEEYIEALSDRLGITLSLDQWMDGWNDLFVGPYENVLERLRTLNGTIPMYAFTNTNPTHEAVWRNRYPEALGHFEEIFVSSTIGLRKPDVDAYEWVAAAMSLAPEEILFLDDTLENVEGARTAGLQTEWIRSEQDVVQALTRF